MLFNIACTCFLSHRKDRAELPPVFKGVGVVEKKAEKILTLKTN